MEMNTVIAVVLYVCFSLVVIYLYVKYVKYVHGDPETKPPELDLTSLVRKPHEERESREPELEESTLQIFRFSDVD